MKTEHLAGFRKGEDPAAINRIVEARGYGPTTPGTLAASTCLDEERMLRIDTMG